MNPEVVKRHLTVLENQYAEYLWGTSWRALASAGAQVDSSYGGYEEGQHQNPKVDRPWGFAIDRGEPLQFTDFDDHRLRFDLYGRFTWLEPNKPCVERLLVVRLWSLDPSVCFRKNWDATDIETALDDADEMRRVVARFHFDQAQGTQPGPRSHLQFGGIPADEELSWWHKGISVPRLAVPPVDLTLGAELVVATMAGVNIDLFDDPSVTGAIKESQDLFLAPYIDEIRAAVVGGESALSLIWNSDK